MSEMAVETRTNSAGNNGATQTSLPFSSLQTGIHLFAVRYVHCIDIAVAACGHDNHAQDNSALRSAICSEPLAFDNDRQDAIVCAQTESISIDIIPVARVEEDDLAAKQCESNSTSYHCLKRTRSLNGLKNKAMQDLLLARRWATSWWTSSEQRECHYFFLFSFIFSCAVTMFYMCGDFRFYLQSQGCFEDFQPSDSLFGPRTLLMWISKKGEWRAENTVPWSFTNDYLTIWGARHLPSMLHGHQWWRWFAGVFVHHDLKHLISNVVVLVLLGQRLERKHGWQRVAFAFFLAHFGGALASALLEDPQSVVIGASGGICGLFGLYVGDWLYNLRKADQPIFKFLIVFSGVAYLIATIVTVRHGTSHISHVGGVIFGTSSTLLCSFCTAKTLFERAIGLLTALIITLFIFCGLFHVYTSVIPNIPEVQVIERAC